MGDGLCGAVDLRKLSFAEKEEFAWRCRAEFPCASSCSRNFSGCPLDWVDFGSGLCLAPVGYEGICSPATDFTTFSKVKKANWASRCGVTWPCNDAVAENVFEVGARDCPV